MKGLRQDNTPMIALFWFRCKCGTVVRKGETYTTQDDCPMCMKCAYPEPEKRRLTLIRSHLKTA